MRFDFVLLRGDTVLLSEKGKEGTASSHLSPDLLVPLIISVEQEFEKLTGVRLHLNPVSEVIDERTGGPSQPD